MMLVALTMERFVAVCHPEKSRALQGSKKAYIIIASIPICTFLTYSPHLFLSTLLQCVTEQGKKISLICGFYSVICGSIFYSFICHILSRIFGAH